MKKFFTSALVFAAFAMSASAQSEVTLDGVSATVTKVQNDVIALETKYQNLLAKLEEANQAEDVESLQAALKDVEDELVNMREELARGVKVADLEALKTVVEEDHDYAAVAVNWIADNGNSLIDLPVAVQENMDAIAAVSSDLQGIQEKLARGVNVEDLEAVKASIQEVYATLKTTYVNNGEFGALAKKVEDVTATADANKEALAIVSDDLQGLMEKSMNFAQVDVVNQQIEEEHEYAKVAIDWITNNTALTDLPEAVQANMDAIAANADAITVLSDDLQGLVEWRAKGNVATIEAVEEVNEKIDNALGYVKHNFVTNTEGAAHAEKITAIEKELAENAEWQASVNQTLAQVPGMFEEEFSAIDEVLANVTNDVQGLMASQRGNASVAHVAEIEEAVAILSDDVQGLQEARRGFATVEGVAEDVALLTTAITNNAAKINTLESLYVKATKDFAQIGDAAETLVNLTDDVQGLMEKSRNWALVEDVAANAEAIEIVSSDLQGLVEAQRGKANVEDVVAIQEALDIISTDLQDQVMANKQDHSAVNDLLLAVKQIVAILYHQGENVSHIYVPEVIGAGEEGDVATEVEQPGSSMAPAAVYNLAGQKVNKAENGVFIVDGVKVKK